MASQKGKYIVLEGGEGCGKSTVIQALKKEFPNFLFIREPGGNPIAEKIRRLILEEEHTQLTDAYLFASARAEIMQTIVKPAIDNGQTVISDRSFLSSVVYQGINGLGAEEVLRINKPALCGITVDLCLWFDLSVDVSIQRTISRFKNGGELTRFDISSKEILNKQLRGFKELSNFGFNIKRINAEESIETVIKKCKNEIINILAQ